MSEKEKIAPLTEFYKSIVFAEKSFDINYKEVAKVLFNEVDRLNGIIDKAIEYIKTFHFIDDIRVLDIEEYEKLLEILGDKENESR